jgi:hypothetical protein
MVNLPLCFLFVHRRSFSVSLSVLSFYWDFHMSRILTKYKEIDFSARVLCAVWLSLQQSVLVWNRLATREIKYSKSQWTRLENVFSKLEFQVYVSVVACLDNVHCSETISPWQYWISVTNLENHSWMLCLFCGVWKLIVFFQCSYE